MKTLSLAATRDLTISREGTEPSLPIVGLTLVLCIAFTAVSLWWTSHDGQPQGADQANHLIRSLEFSSSIKDLDFQRFWKTWNQEFGTYTYPPLYHLLTGLFLLVVTRPAVAGVLSNTVFLSLLIYSVTQIGRRAFDIRTGIVAAILTLMYPIMAELQHEAFVDFALTGMTSWCVWRLLATEGFQKTGASIACGLSVGIGVLVKQLMPLYLVGPGAAFFWIHRHKVGRAMCKNIALSLTSFLLIAIPWYGPHWHAVLATGVFNQHVAAIEGDPMPWTLPGALFYLYTMVSEQVGFATFCITVVAAAISATKILSGDLSHVSQRCAQAAVVWWAISGLFLLTFCILNKDIRYSMPILPAVALVTASPLYWIRSSEGFVVFVTLLGSLALPYYTYSLFSWPPIHRDIGFGTGPLYWNIWKKSYYYGGSPSAEDWSLTDIIFRMWNERGAVTRENPIRLVLVPFLLRLNQNSISLEALQSGIPIDVYQIGNDPRFFDDGRILSRDFLLTKTGDLGLPFMTSQAVRINDFIANHRDRFEVVQSYPFPDGSTGTLFKIHK